MRKPGLPLPADKRQTAMPTELSDSDKRNAGLKLFSSSHEHDETESRAPDDLVSQPLGEARPENDPVRPAELAEEGHLPAAEDQPAQRISLSSIAEWEPLPLEEAGPASEQAHTRTGIVTGPGSLGVPRGLPVSSHSFPMAIPTPDAVPAPLEQRIRRLEDAVAQMQDKNQPETRIKKPGPSQPTAPPSPEMTLHTDAGSHSGPKWLLFDIIAEARVIFRLLVDPRYRMTWIGRIVPPVLLVAFLGAYYVVAAIPFLGLFLLGVPVVGWLLQKVVQLLVAFALFKVLHEEVQRYRKMTPDLPPSLRG
jgi:hypothetical protein